MYTDYQWDAPSWLTCRLARTVAAVLTAVLVVTASGVAWSKTRPEPAQPASPQVLYGGIHVKKDHKFHIGLIEINADGKDVTVLEVTPTMSDNVEFLGAVTTYGEDELQGGPGAAGSSFPPPYLGTTTHPIGEVIPAFKTSYIPAGHDKPAPVIVTAGFRLKSGVGGVNGIRVVYRVGDKKHTEFLRYAAVATTAPWSKKDAPDGYYEDVLRSYGLLPAEDD